MLWLLREEGRAIFDRVRSMSTAPGSPNTGPKTKGDKIMNSDSETSTGPFCPRLFSQGQIRNLELPNRIVMAPMESNLAGPDGTVSDGMLEYYRTRAQGGVGMVIVEYTCIDRPVGLGGTPQLGLDDDSLIASHARLAEAIRNAGSKACVQLFHAGRQTHPTFTEGQQAIAASPIPCPMYRKMPREMNLEDIHHVARKYGEAAARAARAGYDAVELHGAHGYLLGNFLSAASNRRTDAFGGALENRQRFPLMVIEELRKRAGDLPVIFRLSADEFVENGTTLEEAVDTAQKLADAGVDAIHVSTGCHERIDRNVDPVWMPEGWRLPLAREIRNAVDIPVIGVGVIRHPDFAENAIATGSADFIALGRALLADPEWPVKAREGRAADIRPCTSCNWCVLQIGLGHRGIGCAENPLAGHELDPRPTRVPAGAKALVVGAGPGGITAALTLDQAGYDVLLADRAPKLAPGLMASGAAPKKGKFHWYRDYLAERLHRSGVELRLGVEIDANWIAGHAPHITFLATGSVDRKLEGIEGLDLPHVNSAYDILTGEAKLVEGSVVIYGAGEIGCEAAKFAAEHGHEVILSTRSTDKDALSRSNPLRIYREQFVETLKAYPNIRIELGAKLKSVSPDYVAVQREDGEEHWRTAQLLLAVGRQPAEDFTRELDRRGLAHLVVGDANEVRRIGDAVHEAYRAVSQLTRQTAPDGEELVHLAI